MPEQEFSTEWGVKSPWGCERVASYEMAVTIAANMRTAGHEASIVWRGITPWHYEFSDERAMQPAE